MDGMETLRRLRQKSDMPVIFLTSKDEEIDELFGPRWAPKNSSETVLAALLVERVKACCGARRRRTARCEEVDSPKVPGARIVRMDPERHTR